MSKHVSLRHLNVRLFSTEDMFGVKMYFCLLATYFATLISSISSNPNPRKGELMEQVILMETQGKYAEALNAFAEIAALAKNHVVDLSLNERKIFYNCYHYHHVQTLDEVYDADEKVNNQTVQSLIKLFDKTQNIILDLSTDNKGSNIFEYKGFYEKVSGDKAYCQGLYVSPSYNMNALRNSIRRYEIALEFLPPLLGDADVTTLDTYFRLSNAIIKRNSLVHVRDMRACDIAFQGLENGRKVSSENNPDLVSLSQFYDTHCPRKGELMEQAIIFEGQGNHEEALKEFSEIAGLAKGHLVELSEKERKIFYNCYHYYHVKLLEEIEDFQKKFNNSNYNPIRKLYLLYNVTKKTTEDLSTDPDLEGTYEYQGFLSKVRGDQAQSDADYMITSPTAKIEPLKYSIAMYKSALEELQEYLGHADITILDTHLRRCRANMKLNEIHGVKDNDLMCNDLANDIANAQKASFVDNSDLIPLKQLYKTTCSTNI